MQLIDPLTGEVREAGTFTKSEWNALVRNNPEAATLVLQLRRKEREVEKADQQVGQSRAMAVGAVGAGAAFPAIYNNLPRAGQAFAGEWVARGYAKPGTQIYDGPRVGINIGDDVANNGQVVFTVDGSVERPYNPVFADDALLNAKGNPLTGGAVDARKNKLIREGAFQKEYVTPKKPREILADIDSARTNWKGVKVSPEGARLYMATPEAAGVFGGPKGVNRLGDLGFKPTTLGGQSVYTMDARPGARFLGQGYHLVDDLVMKAAQGQGLKPLRFAGALAGALGLGALVAAGGNFIGERL